jgi:hypothetical protein
VYSESRRRSAERCTFPSSGLQEGAPKYNSLPSEGTQVYKARTRQINMENRDTALEIPRH